MRKIHSVIIIGLCLMVIAACKTKEIYPIIPSISYKSAYFISNSEGTDSVMTLIFSFKDGDGDLGLAPGDTFMPYNPVIDSTGKSSNPYYYNLFVNYTEWQNGVFQPVIIPFSTDTLSYVYRFESYTPDGRHKAIRGDIEVKILPSPYPNPNDTVKYSFYIYDRALHQSNIIETPPLVWRR